MSTHPIAARDRSHSPEPLPEPPRIPCDMRVLVSFLALCFAGCAVGPDYQRPTLDVPAGHHASDGSPGTPSSTNSLADLGWWETFQDVQLTAYVSTGVGVQWDVIVPGTGSINASGTYTAPFTPGIYVVQATPLGGNGSRFAVATIIVQ